MGQKFSFAAAIAGVMLLSGGIAANAGSSHGKVLHPTVEGAKARGFIASNGKATSTRAAQAGPLYYRGAVAGVGVTTGAPKVYLVFWGSQWGTQGTDGNGNTTLSGDINGAAPYLQQFFKGLGTNGDLWSGVMTQSCETVSGSTTCPATAQHVGYPVNGVLAGVWVDPAGIISTKTTTNDADIAREALLAAKHFGNLTPDSNRNVQYVVVSPPGTKPGGFPGVSPNQWCAWHDWNGDSTMNGGAVASDVGNFAFTNMPYVTDMGGGCGQNYVNAGSAGTLDGFSLVGGHEYSETITDQFPAGGWTDATGWENADKCSWIGTGGSDGAVNIVLATGTFPVQGQWLNNINGCSNSYSPYSGTPNVITVSASPSGTQTVSGGAPITPVQLSASGTTNNAGFSWSATGLPSGLSLGTTTGTISGTPSTTGSYTTWITVADSLGAVAYSSLNWVVSGTVVKVTPPSNQTSTKGIAVAGVQGSATSPAGSTFVWSVSSQPAGISINSSTGVMSGTPTTVQSARLVTLSAKDVTGSTGSASFYWTVQNTTVTVAPIVAQSTTRGTTVAPVTATASDNNPALTTFTWSASGLPSGLSMSSAGTISGTVSSRATVKTYSVTVTAKDANGATGKTTFSWTVK